MTASTNNTDNDEEEDTLDVRKSRLETSQSGWMVFRQDTELALLMDAMIDATPDHEGTKDRLVERSGVPEPVIDEKMDILEKLGVIEYCGEDSDYWYRVVPVTESPVLDAVFTLNSAMNSIPVHEEHEHISPPSEWSDWRATDTETSPTETTETVTDGEEK